MDNELPVPRRLILLRHAKSQWPAGIDDLDRPLGEKGLRDAAVAGTELAAIAVPDVVLCSPALRTRQTWEQAALALNPPPSAAQLVPVIYGASVAELIDLIRELPPEARTAVVVGHEPTMSSTAAALAGPGSSTDDLARMREKYPTAGIAVLRLPGSWLDLAPETAVLERFLIPRA